MVCSMCRARSSVAAISRRLVAANSASRAQLPGQLRGENQIVTEMKATEATWPQDQVAGTRPCAAGETGGPHRSGRKHAGTFHRDARHVHRQGDPRDRQALADEKKMQARTIWKRYISGATRLHAAQEMDHRGEHRQVDEDLQPQ